MTDTNVVTDAKVMMGSTVRRISIWLFWTGVFCTLWILGGQFLRPLFGAQGNCLFDERLLPMFLFLLTYYPVYRVSTVLLSSTEAYAAAAKQQAFGFQSKNFNFLVALLCVILIVSVFVVVSVVNYPAPKVGSIPDSAGPLKVGMSATDAPPEPWALLRYIELLSVPMSVFLIVVIEMFQSMMGKGTD